MQTAAAANANVLSVSIFCTLNIFVVNVRYLPMVHLTPTLRLKFNGFSL